MPVVADVVARSDGPSATVESRSVSSSEAASLHGRPALTPMIAGSVCGGLMGIAWIIGFTIYFTKRYKRKIRKRKVAAGLKPAKVIPEPKEKVVIPPDPAVLFGERLPGENALPERENGHRHHKLPHILHTHSDKSAHAQLATDHGASTNSLVSKDRITDLNIVPPPAAARV